MNTVIFLDYGCLHPNEVSLVDGEPALRTEGARLFEHAELLADLVAPYPELRIVLSTPWVRTYGLGQARVGLPPTLQRRVIGSIYESHGAASEGVEFAPFEHISRYVNDHCIRSWLALVQNNSGWPDEFQSHFVCPNTPNGLGDQRVREGLTQRLEQLHNQEFQRVTTQHHWTQNMLAANEHMETAGQAIAEATSAPEDACRMLAAKTAVLSCSAAIASAQSLRVATTERNASLLVAFLGNGLDWNRDERSAALKLLTYRVESESTACTAPDEAKKAVSFAEATLQQARDWLASERESRGH